MAVISFLQRYRILSFGLGIIILFGGWVLLSNVIFTSEEDDTRSGIILSPREEAAAMKVRRVFIKDFHLYQDADDPHLKEHGSIESTLYAYVSKGKPDLYTGIIRPDSFKETSGSTAELLVDINPTEVTYKIILSAKEGKFTPMSAVCAPKDQQINPKTTCVDARQP